MINHVWGLLAHPGQELQRIKNEEETVTHLYSHHVLLLAAIPVVSAYIGTTQVGWNFGNDTVIRLSPQSALLSAVLFYLLMLAGVGVMGKVIHWMAHRYDSRPSLHRCIVFAGYAATPLFLVGAVALYPIVWLCLLAGVLALCYSGYLLYLGIPTFLNIDHKEGFIFTGSTFAIGVLVLEFLLAITVVVWGYGYLIVR